MTVIALAALAVVGNGIAAGIMASTVIGVVPYMLVAPYPEYVRMVRFFWPRFDPIMPLLNGAALLIDVVLAVLTRHHAAAAGFAVAAGLLAGVMGISIAKNVPINRLVSGLDAAREPANWAHLDPRGRWRLWNLRRTAVAVAAFVVNVVCAVAVR
jgi:uncharacterized membrane protein